MEEYEGFTKYRSYLLQLVKQPIAEAMKEKQIDSEFYMEQTEPQFKLFNGFSEISSVIETLGLIEIFVSTEPPSIEGINYSNYLHYHVHNYLQEMFILKERLVKYLKLIEKEYKSIAVCTDFKDIIKSLLKLIEESLSSITKRSVGMRNKHVHDTKYTDEELKWLSSTSFLAEHDGEFELSSKKAYIVAKQKWNSIVKKNNKEVKKLIDLYFSTCYSIITYDNDN